MLIITPKQFLDELKSLEPSKSMCLAKSNDNEPIDISSSNSTVDIVLPNDIVEATIVEDVTVLENDTYNNFRKPSGVPNIPSEVKSIIGALALTTSSKETAEAFRISKDTVGNLVNDNHSNEEVKEVKHSILERIKENSLRKIDACVDFLKILEDMPNKELLYTAESLSRIHRNITPVNEPPTNIAQFVFYVPESQAKIEEYEVVEANT